MSTNIERLEAVFSRALGFPPDERAAFLAGACGQDTVLLERARALLQVHEASEGILPEHPRAEAQMGAGAERPGDRIAHYKLLEKIGEGGCGVVYMAEQEEPVRRRVALKVIKLGMDTRRVVARFEAERQALALMDHPNIARVLDAGATQAGRPFFVMELVKGVKITDYCEQNRIPTTQRVELVVQICRAIQHAHQKGIIHRDIKPSNVLVTVHDGVPVPKVIDFGIAKAIEGRLTEQTLFTSFEQFIGTPAYMSPEQAELKGLDVDTRTDIYSLGVLLYELLIGRTPFDAKELLSAGLDAMRRTIREKEPPRPSTRLTMEMSRADRGRQQAPESKGATSADHRNAASDEALASNTRQLAGAAKASSLLLERRELIKALRGDLDWIVMKCLEKDRTRRYETANGLAMDLLRHLKGEPVVARPQSKFYRFQKLARRNKLVFLAAAGVALALVLGTAGSTLEAVRARRAEREQQRLHREADRARGGEAEQRVAAERHLYDALLGEARAKQLSGRAGQRFESLEAIGKAAAIRRTTDLSDAAVTAFALPDVREQKRWRFPAHWMAANVCFDESCELYACITNSGIVVRRVQDEQQVSFLTLKDVNDFANGLLLRRFDSRSRYLAASCVVGQGELRSRVWELTRAGTLVLETDGVGDPDFSPDGMAIAMLNPDGSVSIEDLETGKELRRLGVGGRLTIVRFSPDGTKLAGLENGGIAAWVMDASSGQTITTLPGSGALSYLSWSRDGNLLAMGYVDGRIEVWDVHASRVRVRLAGHEARVTGLAFSQQGNMLASASWDSTLRLWDVPSGRQWVMYRTQDVGLHFSRDDRTLAYAVEGEVTKLLEVGQATGYRRLSGRADGLRAWNTEFSPDGRLMVVSANDGIGIWDTDSGKEIGHLPTSACRSARFQTYGGLGIIGCTEGGLYRWPLRSESTARGSFLRLDPPQILAAQQTFRYAALNADGRKLLASREVGVDPLLLDLAGLTNRLNLQGHFAAQFVTLDPAGRWAATGTWKGIGVKIYDAVTGELLHELPVAGTAVVAFSPDGNWLATANMTELKLWQTSSWDCAPRAIPGDHVSEINPLAFSPDGRLLAYMHGGYEIRMVKVPSCEVVATLRVPSLTHVSSLTFSPDGARFAALEWSGQINIWDLRALRRELVNLNLDWDLPPFPPATNAAPFSPARLQFDAGPFSEEELAQLIPRREPDIAGNLIDLSDYYNAPLTESWHSPRAAKNDLSGLTPGIHELGGVGFDVRGLIQLGVVAPNFLPYPNHVLNIPIGRKCRRLHFLHAAIYSGNAHLGDELGSYVFHYADGRQEQRPIVMGKDMVDWWSLSSQTVTNCQIAWTGKNPVASREGHSVRLFKTTWENPFPNVPIVQFDFTSDKPTPGQPFLVAVTAEP